MPAFSKPKKDHLMKRIASHSRPVPPAPKRRPTNAEGLMPSHYRFCLLVGSSHLCAHHMPLPHRENWVFHNISASGATPESFCQHYCTRDVQPETYRTDSDASYSEIIFMLGSNSFDGNTQDPQLTASYVMTHLMMLAIRFNTWLTRNGKIVILEPVPRSSDRHAAFHRCLVNCLTSATMPPNVVFQRLPSTIVDYATCLPVPGVMNGVHLCKEAGQTLSEFIASLQ